MRRRLAALPLLLAAVAVGEDIEFHPGQSRHKAELFDREFEERRAELEAQLRLHPDFDVPSLMSTTDYRPRQDLGYTQNIIIDPCKYRDHACCEGVFGTPEYKRNVWDAVSVDEFGDVIETTQSRWPNADLLYDTACVEEGGVLYRLHRELQPNGSVVVEREVQNPAEGSASCVEHNFARGPPPRFPVCWDHNATVVATDSCTALNGSVLPNCIAVAYTQNAFVVGCGGEWEDSPRCGTFLELHRAGDPRIMSETRLPPGLHTGYHTTTVSMTFENDLDKVVCRGNYEIWWVVRTRSSFVVEKVKPLYVTAPTCDFDVVGQVYEEFVALR